MNETYRKQTEAHALNPSPVYDYVMRLALNVNSKFLNLRFYLLFLFISLHLIFSTFLGELFALAPDEMGYLSSFNQVYTLPMNTIAQSGSGWITAPTIFLWMIYLPAKIMTIFGLSDLLAIRYLSIIVVSFCLYAFLKIQSIKDSGSVFPQIFIFASFMVPSIFLWTSVGLREPFIILEITLFFIGIYHLSCADGKKAFVYLSLGSYGLLSTKPYLWVILMISLYSSYLINLVARGNQIKLFKLLISSMLIPLLVFASTTTTYALTNILGTDITQTGERSGDSITEVIIVVEKTETKPGTETKKITFHGDFTLVAMRKYLNENPDAPISIILDSAGITKHIEKIWNKKIALGLASTTQQITADTSSVNGYILKPGKIHEPLSLLRPALLFLFGPFPFIEDSGFAVSILSFESPLWWVFYLVIFLTIIKGRKKEIFTNMVVTFPIIFFLGITALAALVEVNLGTSFRHRSVILAPLLFLFVMSNIEVKGKTTSNIA